MAGSVITGAAIWAVATRITALDPNGYPVAGANSFTTDRLLKATLTPVVETGDDVAIKNAAGDISAWGKHGDMVKYGTLAIELTTPNPELEQVMAGGVAYSDSSVALGLPTGLTVTGQTTLGVLAAGVYGYRATQFNSYGESLPEAEVQVTTTGSTGAVVVGGITLAAGALGARVYGRSPGGEQYLGSIPNIGSQADMPAGPGANVGYQMPALGAVANTNGVSIEFFMKRMIRGYQAADYPYYRILLPRVTNLHTLARDITNANFQTQLEGQAFENPNWGSGPFGDWQFDSTKMAQRAACGAQILPVASQTAVQATV